MNQRRTWTLVAALALLVSVAPAEEKEPSAEEAPKLTVGHEVGQRLPQFRTETWDFSGEKPAKTDFDSHKNKAATAYVFMSRTCPYCRAYEGRLAEMSKEYAKKGIRFVMVYPTRATPAEQKIAYHKKAGLVSAPFVNDKDASIAKALHIKKTPEVVLTTKKGEIVFRGGIDDNPRNKSAVKKPHLKNACEDVVAGRKVKVTSAPLYG